MWRALGIVYVLYLMKEHPDKKEQYSFLNGEEGEYTISAAFFWGSTKEGLIYWGKKEHKFIRWYYRRGIEIFRCKWFVIEI